MGYLNRATGPECLKCGCNDMRLISAGNVRGVPFAHYECSFCGAIRRDGASTTDTDIGILYRVPRCPSCGAKRPHVVKTLETAGRNTVRYHRCGQCGTRFKSVEV